MRLANAFCRFVELAAAPRLVEALDTPLEPPEVLTLGLD